MLLWFGCAMPGAESHWIRLRSTNFEIFTSAGPRNARDTLKEFEQVRGFFLQAFGGPPAKPIPVRLVAFSSGKEYEPYRLNEFAIAYYHQTPDRDYIVMSRGGADTFPIAVHEYVHLLIRHAGLNLPPWLNEGMAELYSTLRPLGDKILVGDLIAGRHQALLQEKWIPLATILAADHTSPYYNEKNKAGSLYNEGWALTHMLMFRAEYRPKFGALMRAISDGDDSAAALRKVYGRDVAQVEKDLRAYLNGSSFQGALVAAKLEKASDEIPVEDLAGFDCDLMFADLLYRPGKEAALQSALEKLVQRDPKRPEPYRVLGYLAWRTRRSDEAVQQFGRAFERGDRDGKMLWDYGRLAAERNPKEAAAVLAQLLAQDTDRMEVRLELAAVQLRADETHAALVTLQPIRKVTSAEAPRFFELAVLAHLRNNDRKNANETALRFQTLAKTDGDRALAERLVRATADPVSRRIEPEVRGEGRPVEIPDTGKPELRRREGVSEMPETVQPQKLTASGRFVELDCRGKQARMIIEMEGGRKVFLIEDPGKVAIVAGSNGPVEMSCGPQKTPLKVEIGYEKGAAPLEGIVKTIAF